MADIADKELYADLTAKQQSVVDAIVDDPTAQNTVLADRAGVSRSTVHNVKKHYGDIVETQLDQRGRDPGEESTTGNPYEGQLNVTTAAQAIQDRPHQPEGDETDATAFLTVSFDKQTVRGVLAGDRDERVRAAVVEALFEQAFDDDA